MRFGGGVGVVGAVAASLVFAAPAGAQLTGWSHPEGIAVAPDNRHVYVGSNDGTLALARDQSTGALTEVGRFQGTRGPLEIAPDGRSVYSGRAAPSSPTPILTAFRRDPGSGALEPVAVSGWHTAGSVADIVVSPDGATVYATDEDRNELAIFARAASDGSLSFAGTAPTAPGVIAIEGMAISPDGRWLYAVGRVPESGGRVVRYERLAGGMLGIAQVAECGTGIADSVALSPAGWLYVGAGGLAAVRWDTSTGEIGEPGSGPWIGSAGDEPGGAGLAVTGDGMLYAADNWEHTLLQARPVPDGFELVRAYRDFQDGARGLRHLRSIATTPDGAHLYAAAGRQSAGEAGTVAVFSRDPATGVLTFTSLFTGGSPPQEFEVTINDGAAYTDDPRVRVSVTTTSPLPGSLPFPQLELANDGGFGDGRLFSVRPDATYPWTLASTGPDRLPKTVYARPAFDPAQGDGGPWRGEAASDTIVLDETRPFVAARRVRASRLRVRARDRISGVRRIQIARRRGAPGRWRPYRARRLYSVRPGKIWVRARDRAGNRSRWRAVRAAGAAR